MSGTPRMVVAAYGGLLQTWPWVHNFIRFRYLWKQPAKDAPLLHYIQHTCNVTICGAFVITIVPSHSICGTFYPHQL
jgi:hypothetical protein